MRDRGVRVCLVLAVLIAVGNEWVTPATVVAHGTLGDSTYWLLRLAWIAPYAVALVAVVATARAGAGVLVAGVAYAASMVAVVIDPGVQFSQLGVAAHLLDVAALLPADLMATQRRSFDLVSGTVAGLTCGIGLALVAFLWALPRVADLPGWYVLGGYVFPVVVMSLVGAAVGAARRPVPAH